MLRGLFLVGLASAVPRNQYEQPSLQAGSTGSFQNAKSTELAQRVGSTVSDHDKTAFARLHAQRVADDLSPYGTAEPPAVKSAVAVVPHRFRSA